jgi:hypothetical protein
MISKTPSDGSPVVWFNKVTGLVLGVGCSSLEYDESTDAVAPCDESALQLDRRTLDWYRNADGSFRSKPKPTPRLSILRDKRRSGQELTVEEQRELLDLLLGV